MASAGLPGEKTLPVQLMARTVLCVHAATSLAPTWPLGPRCCPRSRSRSGKRTMIDHHRPPLARGMAPCWALSKNSDQRLLEEMGVAQRAGAPKIPKPNGTRLSLSEPSSYVTR